MTGVLVLALLAAALYEIERRRTKAEIGTMSKRVTALHLEVAAWQACHDHTVAELDRRMSGLEATTAMAANEIRMASSELMAHRSADGEGTG